MTPPSTSRLNMTEASPAIAQGPPLPSIMRQYPYCRMAIPNCPDTNSGTDWLSDSQEQIYGGFGLGAALGLLFFALIYLAWFRPWYKRRCQTVRRAWLHSQGNFSEDIVEAS
ncbi:hypothetical protein BGZ60DRAFT_526139 [Tricladium varicosporioides]|nr:hypothetical protein BGZ60DRAFT_526139 [Hymenoscyphus varicosporioides]